MEYFYQQLQKADIKQEPFFHCVVNNALQDKLYKSLIEEMPNNLFHQTPTKNELRLIFPEIYKELPKVWKETVDILMSDDFKKQIINKFSLDFDGKPEVVVFDMKKHYKLGPHVDSPYKLFTSLFYLPPDNSLESYGTILYKKKVENPKKYNWADFKEVKRVNFKPNTFFCFGGKESYHGLEVIEEDIHRVSMQYLITEV